jgi:hypothetical protein
MEELTATAKPFVPQSSHQKKSEISATASPFVPKQVVIAPVLTVTHKGNSKQIPGKVKKSGKKEKVNGVVREKKVPNTATTVTKQTKLTVEQKPKSTVEKNTKSVVDLKAKLTAEQKKKRNKTNKSSRDEEVRELTSRLQEKDEQLKEMEALQSQERIAQSAALAKQVEDKVTQKLFKASVLSNMYKAHVTTAEQPAASAPTTTSRHEQTQPPSKTPLKQSKGTASNAKEGRSRQKDKIRREAIAGGDGGGGTLRVPAKVSPQKDSGGGGRGRGTGTGTGGVKPKVYSLTPEELQERDLLRAIKERAATERCVVNDCVPCSC